MSVGTLHVGLVGGGGITTTPAEAAAGIPGVEITAIQGANQEKVRALCARHGGTADGHEPRCDGREGRRRLALVEAIYRASRTGTKAPRGVFR